ncbi:MAG: helix-turn-helix transcriptional regulator [Gemmatimonadota bacterium]|nr:helix-turn-helix transcriptional regulator [Gemmatimonadota bacterium]
MDAVSGTPLVAAAQLLCAKWKPLLLYHLSDGCHRFGELQSRMPGITHKVLIEQLRALERDGLIVRRVIPGRQKYSEYLLTSLGAELRPWLGLMEAWGERYQAYARHRALRRDVRGWSNATSDGRSSTGIRAVAEAKPGQFNREMRDRQSTASPLEDVRTAIVIHSDSHRD